MFFSPKLNYPFGLDISDLSLKLVQLRKVGNKVKIQALNKLDLPPGLIERGIIKNEEEVAKKIQELINKPKIGKIASDSVVACLPETETFIKLIKIEKNPNPIADIIEGEIEKHIPFSINEIFYDWQLIEDREGEQLVLIGAAPKTVVNQYSNLLDRLKLSIWALEIEPIAICRSLLPEESAFYKGELKNNYAIIDIGSIRTNAIFYSKNTILFTVSMPISGNKITKTISEKLDIETDQAEKAKIICGLDKKKAEGVVYKILSDTINNLKSKINQAFDFYHEHYAEFGPINKIILCGGGANIKGLAEIIESSAKIKVEKGNPLINLRDFKEKLPDFLSETYKLNLGFSNGGKKKNSLSITQDISTSFATAIGLALRDIFIKEL